MNKSQSVALTNYFLILVLWVTAFTYGVLLELWPSLYSDNSPLFYHPVTIVISLFLTKFLIVFLEALPIKGPEELDKINKISEQTVLAVSKKNRVGLFFLVLSTVISLSGASLLWSFLAALIMSASISILMTAYYEERRELELGFFTLDHIVIILLFSLLSFFYVATENILATTNTNVKVDILKLILGASFGFFSTLVNHHMLLKCNGELRWR